MKKMYTLKVQLHPMPFRAKMDFSYRCHVAQGVRNAGLHFLMLCVGNADFCNSHADISEAEAIFMSTCMNWYRNQKLFSILQ